MKFLSLNLCAAASAAAAILDAAATDKTFNVTDFYASHIPHSLLASLSFYVSGYECTNTTAGLGFGDLMLESTGTCADNVTQFTFLTLNNVTDSRNGFAIRLVDEERGIKGHKHFKKSDLYYLESPPGSGFEWATLSEGQFVIKGAKI